MLKEGWAGFVFRAFFFISCRFVSNGVSGPAEGDERNANGPKFGECLHATCTRGEGECST